MRRLFRDALLMLAFSACAGSLVRAHAPIPQRVAVAPDGGAVALSLPGFGLLFRARQDQPFAYACDALLDVAPSDRAPALAFLRDGALLLGTASGARSVAPDGCPRADVTGPLASAPIVAMSVRPGADETIYAVASGEASGLWRSSDGGKHWEMRAPLAGSENVSALAVSTRAPEQLYVSLRTGLGTTVLSSSDGGASFTAHAQALPLSLLSADGPAPYPLWAITRDALTMGNRSLSIQRAQRPEGPWQEVLRVNYFGGLVVDAQGVIWVGDEIGGIYRSDDGGAHFQNLEQDADVACLAAANGALWACTPGTTKEPALQQIVAGQPRSALVALDSVDQLVSCRDQDVSQRCAAAWNEWQRDVRQLPIASADAGPAAAPDASAGELAAAHDASATIAEASVRPLAGRAPHASCALRPYTRERPSLCLLLWLLVALRATRRRDRKRP